MESARRLSLHVGAPGRALYGVETMIKSILGRKVGMTQLFDEAGKVIPVTIISAGPCVVVQKKTVETDGYEAVQVGFEDVKESRLNKPLRGVFSAHKVPAKRHLKEFRGAGVSEMQIGQEINADVFSIGDLVDVTGTSKGKGFAGGVKRYHFRGGPASHGSMIHRKPQSGGATDAARVFKGTRKPGHMGAEQVTAKRLRVIRVDAEKNMIAVRGAVPGADGGLVVLRGAK